MPEYISAGKRYYKENIVEPEFVVNKDGAMDVTDKPGIGVGVKEKNYRSGSQEEVVFQLNYSGTTLRIG